MAADDDTDEGVGYHTTPRGYGYQPKFDRAPGVYAEALPAAPAPQLPAWVMGSLAGSDSYDTWPAVQEPAPPTPIGNPMGEAAPPAPQGGDYNPIGALARGAAQMITTPGSVMQPNPYPAGSEQASWYDDQRAKVMTDWAPQMALNTMGATPFGMTAEAGVALGAGPVRRAALDTSEAARLARAQEQGFDVSTPLYHGTSKDADFAKFRDTRHGTWTTTDPAEASSYAAQNDSRGFRFENGQMVRTNTADRVLPLYGRPLENPYTGPVPDAVRNASNYKTAQSDWFDQLRAQGYDGVDMGGGTRVDFRNENLRSTFAPFDPANATRSVILGAGPRSKRGGSAIAAMGDVAAPLDARAPLPEPPIATAPDAATLFDYSRVHEVPDVPQFDLPRYNPPRGVSDRMGELIGNKKVEQQMLDYLQQGKQIGQAPYFYYNEPLRQAFIDELGKSQGQGNFAKYMDYVAATSPRSKVPENARNASYYYVRDLQGEPPPNVGDPIPAGYGHMAQKLHQGNVNQLMTEGGWDVFKNPKPASFSQNLQGNYAPITADAHAVKLPAMLAQDPRFLATSFKPEKGAAMVYPQKLLEQGKMTMGEMLDEPTFWSSKPRANEYPAFEQYYKQLAREAGFPAPAMGQASGWAAGGPVTGLGSVAGDPFMRAVEARANLTAAQRGLTPAEALSQFIRGKKPLLSIGGGAAAMGSLAAQDRYQQEQ